MLLQTNSYVVPKEKRNEHARLVRRFRQTMARLGCDQFEVYEQVSQNWTGSDSGGRFVQIMRFRDRRQQLEVQAAERTDPAAQALIQEFCELINFPFQQQQGLFAVGFYNSVLPTAFSRETQAAAEDPAPPAVQSRAENFAAAVEASVRPLAWPASPEAESTPEELMFSEMDALPEESKAVVEGDESATAPEEVAAGAPPENDDDFAALIAKLPREELRSAIDEFAQIIAKIAPEGRQTVAEPPGSQSPVEIASGEAEAADIEQIPMEAAPASVAIPEAEPANQSPADVDAPVTEEFSEETVQHEAESAGHDQETGGGDLSESPWGLESDFADSSADDSSILTASAVSGPRLVSDEEDSDPEELSDSSRLHDSEHFSEDGRIAGEHPPALQSQLDVRLADAGEPVEPHDVEAIVERADGRGVQQVDDENPGEPIDHLEGHQEVEPHPNGTEQHQLTPATHPHMRLARDDDPLDHIEDRDIELFEPDEPVSPFGT